MNGRRGVRLEAVAIGRRWYTSQEALQRFVEASKEAALRDARRNAAALAVVI